MTALTLDNPMTLASIDHIPTPSAYEISWEGSLLDQFVSHSTSISSTIDKAVSFLLAQGVRVENHTDVTSFLASNYGVVANLYDAVDKVEEYFGNSDLEIGVFSDPEDNDDMPELYLEVSTTETPEEANSILSRLNREWILASGDQDLLSINVTLKFI